MRLPDGAIVRVYDRATLADTFTWSMSKMHMRAAGQFDARLNGALLLPAVPIAGEFETLLGHVSCECDRGCRLLN